MDMPTADEHPPLEQLAGRWVGTEKMYPSRWLPEGGTAEAHVDNRLGAGGRVLSQHYEQRRDGQTVFSGHGVFWFDEANGEQALHWWDSMSRKPDVFRGTWDGNRLVLRSQNPMGHTRGTWVVGEDGYTHTMEMSPDGEAWALFMEGTYRRASS